VRVACSLFWLLLFIWVLPASCAHLGEYICGLTSFAPQAVLLNELAERLGADLCKQFVIPEVVSLSEDPLFRVRKAVALNLDGLFRTVDAAVLNDRLLPAFVKLSKDEVWGVRKACAESLVSVSPAVEPVVRIQVCCPPCREL
jgi:serine/threonine-protein phosphatase 4 regulatory subunit 1